MKSPFKFLDSYTKEDRGIFFGRDREIEELYHRVFESRIMLVYGISGTGKSSLIHCGLANKFQDTDWLPIVIRRGGNILDSLAAGISAAAITEKKSELKTPASFRKAVKSLYLDYYKPVFFIFDQFEELFIFGSKDERKEFIQIVKLLTESDLQCRMIFVMREEYMAGVTEFEKYIPTFFSNRVRIEKMSHLNAIKAIEKSCEAAEIGFERGFAEALLERLSPGNQEVELTYMQVYLDRLFKSANEKNIDNISFTSDSLRNAGNVSDLLGSFLDDQVSLMENPDYALTILKAFVSGKGTKRQADDNEITDNVRSFGKEIPLEDVKQLIQLFVKLRVLRADANGKYELRHDALAEKIYDKFSTVEKELLETKQFIENSYHSFLKRNILLSHEDLVYIADRDVLLKLDPEMKDFLSKSRINQNVQKRTIKRLTTISFISFLILIGTFGYFAVIQIFNARTDYDILRLSSISDPEQRFKKVLSIWEKNKTVLPKEALLKSFNNLQESYIKPIYSSEISQYKINFDDAPGKIQYARLSKDDKFIYGYGDSLIFIWNINGKLVKTILTEDFPIIDIKFSDDNELIGALGSDSTITVWRIDGIKQFSKKVQFNLINPSQAFLFTGENNVIAMSKDFDAVLLSSKGDVLQTFKKHSDKVNAVDVSADNNFIATSSSDKTINIWYYNSVKKRYDFYNTLTWHKDTVWSATFSKNGINIISTSSDKSTIIGNINNQVNFNYSLIIYDPSNPDYPELLGCCYAEITDWGNCIVLKSFSYKDENSNKYYAYNRINPKYDIHNREGDYGYSMSSYLVFSGDGNYYASAEQNRVILVDNRLGLERNRLNLKTTHTLVELIGNNPMISSDSKYLFYTVGQKLQSFLINTDTIAAIGKKIF